MKVPEPINRFFNNLEWRWSLITMIVTAVGSFALPAWAVKTAELFADYSPASWVIAGFCGLLIMALVYGISAWARTIWIRSNYDAKMISSGSYVDPMAKTFEDKRIFLNEFSLPSFPLIEKKTFINCELIGPACIVLQIDNNVQELRYPISDAVLLRPEHLMYNGLIFRSCIFRQCSFQRVTFLVPFTEYENTKNWQMLNWITGDLPSIEHSTNADNIPVLPASTGDEKS